VKRYANVLASRASVSLSSLIFTVLFGRLIVDSYGFHAFAAVALITSLPTLLPFMDFGAGPTIVNAGADLQRDPGDSGSREAFVAAVLIIVSSALLVLAVGFLISVSGIWETLLGEAAAGIPAFGAGAALAMVALAASLVNAIPARLLQSWQKNSVVFWIAATAPPLSLLGAMALQAIAAPVGVVAASPVLSAAIVAAVCWFPAVRRYPGALLRDVMRIRPRRSSVGETIHLGFSSLVVSIGLVLGFQLDRVILSHLSTARELGYYSLVAPLYLAAFSMLNAIGQNLWPKYRHLVAENEMSKRVLFRDLSLLGGLGAAGAVGIAVLAPIVAAVIGTGDADGVPISLIVAFAALLFMQSLHVPSAMMLTDRRGFAIQRNIVLGVSLLNLAVSAALAPAMGAVGVCIGSLVGVAVQMPVTLVVALRTLDRRI